MRWLKFTAAGKTSWGIVEGDKVVAISGEPFGEWQRTPQSHVLKDVKIELPVMPKTFYCVGLNYLKHLKEAADKAGTVPNIPDRPEIGYRAQNALIAHDENVVIPANATEKIHYEGELVVVIGKKAKHLTNANAMSCVFGYTIGNDVSERTWQKADRGLWRAKNADTFKPMGPWIETELDLDKMETINKVNGRETGRFHTNDMIFGIKPFLVEMTKYFTLWPGDVIWMGTDGASPDIKDGDVVEIEITGIGKLRNKFVRDTALRKQGMSRHTTAHHFLEGLVDLGVDYIFANLGTDHVSLIEELARWDKEGRKHPEMILCPHEVVAVHMAGGYALATGRAQAVLVHVDAGTANACMAIQNLFRYRLPVMLFAGRAPHTLHGELTGSRDAYVHFVQDPFDIAGIVRPYVKWEYSLPSGVVVKEALTRASAFAQSDPPGPVYMMLPRETLAEEWEDAAMPAYPPARYGSVQSGGIEPARVEAIAKTLMAAENPIALTAYLGRKPHAVDILDRLARTCGIRVAEFNSIDLNLPQDSPCFAGFDPLPLLEQADLGLLLDSDVPFIPRYAKGAGAVKWIQIDIDPLKSDFPMWGFATDMRIQGDCAIVLKQVLDAVEARADDAYRRRVADRIASWSGVRETSDKRRAAASANKGISGALSPAFVFATLGAKLSQDDIVINEAIRNGPVLQEHLRRTRPASYVGLAGGGLGFSGGMALGLKLAQEGRRIVQVIGDGGFHFSSPDSVYAVAQQYQLPVLTVVVDNGGWQAVKSAVQRVYPKGIAAETDQFQSRLTSGRQGEMRDFSAVAKAFGAHGERVTEPDDLAAAIDRCLATLDDGKAAVLHVHVTRL